MIYGLTGKKQSGKSTVAEIWQLLDVWYNKTVEDTTKEFNKFNTKSDIEFVKLILEEKELFVYKINKISSWKQKSFAYKIKQIICIIFGCTMEDLEKEEFKSSQLPDDWKVWRIKRTYVKNRREKNEIYYYPSLYSTKEEALEYCPEDILKDFTDTYYEVEEYLLTYRELLQLIGTELFRNHIHLDIWVKSLFSDYKDSDNWIISDVRFKNEAEAILNKGGKLIKINRDTNSNDNHSSETGLNNFDNYDYQIDNNGSLEGLITQVKEIMIKECIIK